MTAMRGVFPRIAQALLLAQLFLLLRAFFARDRYFAWAPYDEMTEFEIRAWEGDRMLATHEVGKLFGVPVRGRENRCAHHLFDKIERGIATAAGSALRVELRFSLHGRTPQTKVWGPTVAERGAP
jgi:hypothetical protein